MTISDSARASLGAAVLAVVWLASAVYVFRFVQRGWIPLDEGSTAMAAERVLQGDLVHRDFEGGYTGGLSDLHAVGFKLLGTRLSSLRIVLFVFFLAFVPTVYSIARRFWRPVAAGAVTLLAVVWSVPNYFASMPSWYNLFFALFGTLAVLRFVDTSGRVWLFGAGVCAGCSVLAKVTGLYFVAALLLFLAHAAQTRQEPGAASERRSRVFALLLALCAAVFVTLLLALIWRRAAPMDVLHYVVPGGLLSGYLVWYQITRARGSIATQLRRLFALLWPTAAGFVTPIVLFLVPYAASGSLRSVAEGLTLNTRRQLETTKAMMYLPPFEKFWAAVPYLALLAFPMLWPRRWRTLSVVALAVILAALLAATDRASIYRPVWMSVQSMAVVAVLAGCRFLLRAREQDLPASRRLQLFLLLCVTAMVSLVQFPFASPVYFCYAAPAAILVVSALVASDARAPRGVHGAVLVFYAGFAVWRLNPAYVFTIGHHPEPYLAGHRLALDRGGILVPEGDGRLYEELVGAIQSVDSGSTIYAGPDCPEVYFLSARKSPLNVFMEFQGPLYEQSDALLRLFDARDINTVVINRAPTFSRRFRPAFLSELERRFPHSREIGRFLVRWRRDSSQPSYN